MEDRLLQLVLETIFAVITPITSAQNRLKAFICAVMQGLAKRTLRFPLRMRCLIRDMMLYM